MTIYLDITQLEKQRVNTGIQRVVKEFINRLILKETTTNYRVLIFNTKINKFQLVDNHELKLFMEDIKKFQFTKKKTIDIKHIKPKDKTIFFDLDSSWNAPYKRDKLYPLLKANGFLIYNFIHDLIPILFPQYVQDIVVKNFIPYINTVIKHSDYVLFNSNSSQKDFLEYQYSLNIKREIPTKVTYLGSDFYQSNKKINNNIIDILSKKYILFVGTLEPRKNHKEVLDAFDILSSKYEDLNLVFIGIKGWNNESLFSRLENHPLKNKRLFCLENIDDDTLYHFYQNAFLVTYISKYEGFGLPIIESLQHGNITIISNNSSMPEVGLDLADYIDDYDIVNQLANKISLYCDDKQLYQNKQDYIKNNFKAMSWEKFSNSILDALNTSIRKNMNNTIKNKIKSIPVLGNIAKYLYQFIKPRKQNKNDDFLDKYYLAFENKFRGSRNSILKRYESYLKYIPTLNTQHPTFKALDIGSGRGEWTQLLQQRNIDAHGVDMNKSMTKVAIDHGVKNLKVQDAFSYLKASKDNSFDLITAFHIIEHIPYEELLQLLIQIKRVARPNATILLETPNPKNIQVAACNFYTDPTHLNPLPPEVVKFMLEYIGFKDIKIEFLNPISTKYHIDEDNQAAKKINELFYQGQDYLIIVKNEK